MIKRTGLLTQRDLTEWITDDLRRFGISSDAGALRPQAGDGLHYNPAASATPHPFAVIPVAFAATGRPSAVRIQPGVIIGGSDFVIPTVNGSPICGRELPVFWNPKKYLVWKISITPIVLVSTVTQTDLDTSPGNAYPASTSTQHWISGMGLESAELVTTDDMDDFPLFTGVGWNNVDGELPCTIYYEFAQWVAPDAEQPNVGSYESLLSPPGVIVFNSTPGSDLINTGGEGDNTEATFNL